MSGRLIRERGSRLSYVQAGAFGVCFIPKEKAHAEMDHSRYSGDYDVRRLC
jgi:hypothetical protein